VTTNEEGVIRVQRKADAVERASVPPFEALCLSRVTVELVENGQ